MKKTVKKVKAAKTVKVATGPTPIPTAEAAVTAVTALVTSKAASVVTLKVIDDKSLATANEMLVVFKQAQKELDEKKKFFLGPLKEGVKRLEAQFKIPAQRLSDADREVRSKVVAYLNARSAQQVVEKAKFEEQAQQAAAAGDDEAALEAATAAVSVQTRATGMVVAGGGTVGVKNPWVFEITDYGAVPQEYYSLDEKKIRAAVQSGLREIPGVRIYQSAQLAVGGV